MARIAEAEAADAFTGWEARGAECLCGSMRMAARAITRLYDEALAPAGVRANQLAVLWAAAALPGAAVRRLGEAIVMEESALLRTVRLLERSGWVRLVQAPHDGRQRIVELTPAGRATLAAALPLWQDAQRRAVAALAGVRHAKLGTDLFRAARAMAA